MHTDRNLLFGVLALQADVITAAQFVEACTVWAGRKDVPLADLLGERGWLTPDQRAAVELLLATKLRKHGGDPRASLRAVVTTPDVRDVLAAVPDPDIRQTFVAVSPGAQPGPAVTTAYEPESRQRYTLTRLHAKGGIGQVWLAHDEDLGRDVALKELRPECQDNPGAAARFLEEAKVTGQLEHPGIVPIYELLKPQGGRPCYTMRFVGGGTLADAIRDYHRKRQVGQAGPLELRELLAAFVAACNAVAYANARGVLHRDLKPQNVALGDFGEVLVLDWGLAKVVDGPAEATSLLPVVLEPGDSGNRTQQGQVLGTPAYMAPEQAEGRLDRIDARTDVYGQGAVLYELLTGAAPFRGADTLEVLHRVVHDVPVPPRRTVATTPAALEAICLKALAKRPEDRYRSVAELAKEVQSWLADEPVRAYREPVSARLGRWARRHKPVVSGAAALLVTAVVALTGGTLLLSAANRRTHEQRDRADENFRQARQAVDTYLTLVSEEPMLNAPGLHSLREKLLRSALSYYQTFVEQHGDDPQLRTELAEAYQRLGRITAEIGSRSDAKELLSKAIALYDELLHTYPADANLRAGLARCHFRLANLQVFTGQPKEGEQSAEAAIALLQPLWDEDKQVSEYGRLLGQSHDLVATSYAMTGRYPEAVSREGHAIAVLRETNQITPNDVQALRALAMAYSNLGGTHSYFSQMEPAYPAWEEAIKIYEELVKRYPANARFRADLSLTLRVLGRARFTDGQYSKGLAPLQRARDLVEKLADQDPDVLDYKDRLAACLNSLGECERLRGRTALGQRLLERSAALHRALEGKDPRNPYRSRWLADTLCQLGDTLAETGNLADSRSQFEAARELYVGVLRSLGDDPQAQLVSLLCRERIGQLQPKRQQSLAALQEIIPNLEILAQKNQGDPEYSYQVAVTRLHLAEQYILASTPLEALEPLEKALPVLEKLIAEQRGNNPYSGKYAEALAIRARVQALLKDSRALEPARQALKLVQKLAENEPAYLFELGCDRALVSDLIDSNSKEAAEAANAAVAALGQAVQEGYDNLYKLQTDPRLASVRARTEFQMVLQRARANREGGKK
jgi:serine/threonine-protein kinase